MPLRRVNVNALLLALSASGVLSGAAGAQQYPVRPIRMVVGFAAGGATDISARALGQKISETIGQQVVVENRPGASSMLAAEIVARATADGYTLLFANATIAMPSLFAK
ncbi:MAG: Bug family tripartite tricarboxylate transporter substrate binding protein, partial [Burkholderiales bacterium]